MQELERQFHINCVPGDVGRYCYETHVNIHAWNQFTLGMHNYVN